ncbi:modification methylase [Candidatus Magnetoovum chiemensis]|nr:modification methylase [Candidatus Magnetoovum chiemensis]
MKYEVIRNTKYDFIGQSYASVYPNLHKYPATMIPQIGIEILTELEISGGTLLDPYCGSGTSFIAGLDRGLSEMYGFDINPLAVLISRTKFTKVDLDKVKTYKQRLRNAIYEFSKKEENLKEISNPKFYNINFWFSENVLTNLSIIKHFLDKIKDKEIKRLFLVPFSETVRECSYTRNHEFKLYRMKSEDLLHFNPDVLGVYFEKLNNTIEIYEKYYLTKLSDAKVNIDYDRFQTKENYYDVVLTSPPYGDSKTTVAYGQFSMFSNEWLGIPYARRIDTMLMGGRITKNLYKNGIIADYINDISKQSYQRALQVSSFYQDLEKSIYQVADSVKKNGKAVYIAGNRRVKNIQLPTDQFIAEKFEEKGFKHLFTYERLLGNKAMPLQNSPTNKAGQKISTMTNEYIVVCEKQL